MTISYKYMYEDLLNICVNKMQWLSSVLHKLRSMHLLLQTLFLNPGPKFLLFKDLCDKDCFVQKNNTHKMLKSVNNKCKTPHAPACFVLLQMEQISDIDTCSIDSRMMQHLNYAGPLFKKSLNQQCCNLRLPFPALNDRQSTRK